jgi:tetratricopeptide (TPR) repeat protein
MSSTLSAIANKEVTEEEYCSQTSSSSTSRGHGGRTKRSLNMTTKKWKKTIQKWNHRHHHHSAKDDDRDDDAALSLEGQLTTTSHETVKRSNTTTTTPVKPAGTTAATSSSTNTNKTTLEKEKSLGKMLKKLVRVRSLQIPMSRSMNNDDESSLTEMSPGNPIPLRGRIQSEDVYGRSNQQSQLYLNARRKSELDLAIRGRLDGLDTLTIGPARLECIAGLNAIQEALADDDFSTLTKDVIRSKFSQFSFTGRATTCTSADLVSDMIWSSGGQEHPELILEGYNPGGNDRWSVRLGDPSTSIPELKCLQVSQQRGQKTDDESTASLSEDGSPMLPMDRMWHQIWGEAPPPPIPTYLQTTAPSKHSQDQTDAFVHLVATCPVPIDTDEEAFIVDGPEHLRAVYDLAEVSLRAKRFDSALLIFEKLLLGLQNSSNEKLKHLIGATYHNMGIIHMCQKNYLDALSKFEKAVENRVDRLPANHPDIGVSLVRLAVIQFAVEKFSDAIESLQSALAMFTVLDGTRAKVLNSLGVVFFFQRKYDEALNVFTSALEIQRQWLDSPVRRESMIYDASMTLSNMAKVYMEAGQCDLGCFMYEEAFLLQTATYGKEHPVVLSSLEGMGLIMIKCGMFTKASQVFKTMLRLQEVRYGPKASQSIETAGMIGMVHYLESDSVEAKKRFQVVEEWQSRSLSSNHPSKRMISTLISKMKRGKNDKEVWV